MVPLFQTLWRRSGLQEDKCSLYCHGNRTVHCHSSQENSIPALAAEGRLMGKWFLEPCVPTLINQEPSAVTVTVTPAAHRGNVHMADTVGTCVSTQEDLNPSFFLCSWATGEWETCSASCGQTGWQRRWVSCQQTAGLGQQQQEQRSVPSKLCGEDRPVGKQTCNRFPCPASWRRGPWTRVWQAIHIVLYWFALCLTSNFNFTKSPSKKMSLHFWLFPRSVLRNGDTCSVRYPVGTALKNARLCVPALRLHLKTAASCNQSQNAPAKPRPVEVGINWRVCHFVAGLEATGFSLLSLPAGDHKNSIVQWLSRSNTNFSVPKISSSKPYKLVSSVSSCSYHVPLFPLHCFFSSVSSKGLRQSNLWNMEEQDEFVDFLMLFLLHLYFSLWTNPLSPGQQCRADRSVFCQMEALTRYCSNAGFRQMCCKSCSRENISNNSSYSSNVTFSTTNLPSTRSAKTLIKCLISII